MQVFFVASGDDERGVENAQFLARDIRPLGLLKNRHIGLARHF
jgi:hypothetical protein